MTYNYTAGVTTRRRTYTARLEHDDDQMNYEWSKGVELVTWGTRFITDKPGDFWTAASYRPSYPHRAFLVRCGDGHGPFSEYGLAYDYSSANGVIFIPTGDDGFTNPREAAKAILEEYESWANGDVWGYVIEDQDGEEIDSCWGHIGLEYATEAMEEAASHYHDHDELVMA